MHASTLLNSQLNLIDKTKGISKGKHQYELGLWYEQGIHKLSKRPDLAIIWYRKAAKNDHPEAYYKLAMAYAKGTHGLEKRLDFAIRCLEKSAKKGHLAAQRALPEAQYNLANAYEYSKHGLQANLELSVLYYQKAARNGYLDAQSRLPNAEHELAVMFQHGDCGVEKNIERAIDHYKFASKNGISEASYSLGCIYKNKEGLPLEEQDHAIESALYYFKQAARQGDKEALSEIEQIYKEGLAQRPEPPTPVVKPRSVPEGFNRQHRRKPQTVIRKDDGTLDVVGRTTAPIQIAEHQPNAETAALTPGFDHHRQSTSHNDTPDKPHGSKTALDLSESQKENRQENIPSVSRKLPPVPIFRKSS